MSYPVGEPYWDPKTKKWYVLLQGPGGGGYIEVDGPPPEELERQRKEAERKKSADWWKL